MQMVNIIEIENKEIEERIIDYHKKGGALHLSVFEIKENYRGELPADEYLGHLVTARQTIEKANYQANLHFNKLANKNEREELPILKTDFELLDSSGKEIDLEHFLGPLFDIDKEKPLIRGQLTNETLNSYFYYDTPEESANKVDLNKRILDYRKKYKHNRGSFMYAFMEPPYNIQLGNEIRIRGEYVLDFMNFFFSDLSKLKIFAWSTDCSGIFEVGKEWWGSYFWTVYNPEKGWYIGMLASETD